MCIRDRYKTAYEKSIREINPNIYETISKPNNTLAIQYIKAIKKLNSNIKYFPIIRNDGGYNSDTLDDFEFQSASTIRNLINKKIDFTKYAPEDIKKLIPKNIKDLNDYTSIFKYVVNILRKKPENIAGFETGILNLLSNNLDSSIEDTIQKSHNKRHTKSRLQRFVLNYLLDINNELVENMIDLSYIHALKFNDKGAKLLKEIKDIEELQVLTNFKDSYSLNKIDKSIFDIEIKANELYYINDKDEKESFYKNIPFIN